MEGVLTGFSIIGVAILIGFLLGRAGVLGGHGHLALNRMSFYAATPALLLSHASGERTAVRSIAAGVVTNPIIIAAALGLAVAASDLTVPDPLMAPIDLVADAAIPVVLIAFGVSLVGFGKSGDRADTAQVAIASAMKLIVMPLAAYLAATLIFGLEGVPLFAAVLCATLPTGQMVFSYAARYGVAVPLARDTVAVATVACIPMVLLVTLLLRDLR
ncbi:AEC family transporter [Mycetocola sp. 2940]|uniref:AEC family transporter n=1 Tax=Mycetocola sp. 2940 TaxID=3156452 RepID=UPI00339B0A77